MQTENKNTPVSRKKFFLWGVGALSALSAAKFLFGSKPKQKLSGEKVKMLTAEGKLVEVDMTVLEAASKKQKSTNKEIFHWMKNPSKNES